MPVPKKRHSNTRTNKRRATWKIKITTKYSKCPSCGEAVMSHRACPACGMYQGRQVIKIKDKSDKKKEK